MKGKHVKQQSPIDGNFTRKVKARRQGNRVSRGISKAT